MRWQVLVLAIAAVLLVAVIWWMTQPSIAPPRPHMLPRVERFASPTESTAHETPLVDEKTEEAPVSSPVASSSDERPAPLPKGSVSGRVLDTFGQPIEGATVYRVDPNAPCANLLDTETWTRSDSEGRWTLPIRRGGVWDFGALKVGFATALAKDVPLGETEGQIAPDIVLTDGALISGHVLDSTGAPRAGVVVSATNRSTDAYSWWRARYFGSRDFRLLPGRELLAEVDVEATTAADGSYVLRGLTADVSYAVSMRTQRRQVVAPKADVDFALAAADEAEKGKAHVVVRAVDDATGAPITSFEASFANESGAQELRPDRYGWLVEYPLEKPGIAEIDLTAARWVVLIQPTGYFQWTVKHFEIQRIDRTYAITARLKSLQPEGELGSLRVTVVDSTGLHVPAGFVGARWESPHDGGLRRVGEAVREGSIGGPATRSIVERLAGPDIKWTHSDDVTVDERAPDESTRAPFSSSSVATTLPLRDYSEGGEKLVKRIGGGGAKFDGLKIGRYAVNVVPLGDPYMVLLQASAWIRPAQRTDLYLIVEIGGKLLARLKDTEGHPISAEYMILRNNDVRSAPSYPEPLNDTDWVYPALPAGNYSMEVRCWGFEGRTEAVELRAHETTVLEATLSRSR